MSRTIRRKKVKSEKECYHWEFKHYFKRRVYYGTYSWEYYWVPIDKQKESKEWTKHWWKAHRDSSYRYDRYKEVYPKYDSKRFRAESRRQLYHAINDIEHDITLDTLRKQTLWDPYF